MFGCERKERSITAILVHKAVSQIMRYFVILKVLTNFLISSQPLGVKIQNFKLSIMYKYYTYPEQYNVFEHSN